LHPLLRIKALIVELVSLARIQPRDDVDLGRLDKIRIGELQ
jgi:hypothetical protein